MRTIQLEGGLSSVWGCVVDGPEGNLDRRTSDGVEREEAMDIAVAVRLMPKVGDELEVDGSGTRHRPWLVDMVINEFDDQALEEAVLIKEKRPAPPSPPPWDSAPRGSSRRFARPMPVERTAWSSWRRARSTRTTRDGARVRGGVSPARPDLVLTGVQAPTDPFGQTAPYLSAMLGWPQASVVAGVTLDDGRARVVQELRVGGLAGARSPAAGGRRRAVGQLAPLRGNGAAAPGDDRGRAAGGDRQRRGVGSQVQARIPGAARCTRRCSRAMLKTWPSASSRSCANEELWWADGRRSGLR